METPRRRDLLTTVAFATAGVGGLLALWPFIAAMSPAEDVRARRTTFDVNDLANKDRAIADVAGVPIVVLHRTPDEIAMLRNQEPQLRDRNSEDSIQPEWAKNWHRSLRPELMVFIGRCTRDHCVVTRWEKVQHELVCPCCGARYDLAGRAISDTPAPRNLTVPPYRFIDEHTIEFVEGEVLRPPANPA